jgi:AraC-like DNA-binding protein
MIKRYKMPSKRSHVVGGGMDIVREKPFCWQVPYEKLFSFFAMEANAADCKAPPHWHECLEFIYIKEGTLSVLVDGEPRVVKKDDIITMSPGNIHGFWGTSSNTSMQIFLIGYDLFEESRSEIKERRLRESLYHKQVFTFREEPSFNLRTRGLLDEIFDEYQRKEVGFQMMIRAKLLEMEVLYFRKIPEILSPQLIILSQKKKYATRLEEVLAYVHEKFDDPELSIENAAANFSLSVSYFSRFFKEQSGCHFHDYLIRQRLSYAKKELLESDQAITDIAFNCGFNSLATFNRLFKAHTGISPSLFRTSK